MFNKIQMLQEFATRINLKVQNNNKKNKMRGKEREREREREILTLMSDYDIT